jgi:hypothetical protein
MNKTTMVILATAGLLASANGSPIYVDFGTEGAAITATETYNSIAPTSGAKPTSMDITTGGDDFTGLLDTEGAASGVSLNVSASTSATDLRGNAQAVAHDAITGIDTGATDDGFWINCGTVPGTLTFTLTYTGLTGDKYNLLLAPGTTSQDVIYDVVTGTGDDDTFTFTSANSTSSTATWTDVVPVSGEIVLTGTMVATGNFNNTRLNFMSLEAVPEPATLGLVAAFGGAVLFIRRRFMI